MLAFWIVIACIASYIAGTKRRQAVERDEAFLRLESRCLTAEYSLARATSEAASWRQAFVESEKQAEHLGLCFRQQTLIGGDMYHCGFERFYRAGYSRN